MKTILYQPLFINPQAYFVFPQLYHIEKGDSYIEPANITGQLIISDLTKSLTLTPTINTVQDTNQVDFGLFKGKHNGNIINYHSDQSDNDDRLVIGSTKDLLGYQCFIGCHGDILLFNRTLTEYEISWVKNNMMCSKQQEPDIDL